MYNKQKIHDEYYSIVEQTPIPTTWVEKVKYCPNGTTYTSYKENRYPDIIAKSSSQVILNNINCKNSYINANNIYLNIDSNNNKQHFIVCQAPIESTMMKHWLMIWEQKSSLSIMLTDLIENNIKKADQYWPNINQSKTFGSIKVKCIEEKDLVKSIDMIEKYKLRKFSILCNNKIHYHYHIHYTNWSDGSTPNNSNEIYSLIKFTQIYKNKNNPIIIHCSAGIGRSGTFLACYCIHQYIKNSLPSIPNIKNLILNMRVQRFGMIQTVYQYEFIYIYMYFLLNIK